MAYSPGVQKNATMRFWIITLFPEVCESYLTASIIGRSIGTNYIQVYLVNPRDCATDKHKTVDDRPYGGGPGMVMCAEPILRAVEQVQNEIIKLGGNSNHPHPNPPPQGHKTPQGGGDRKIKGEGDRQAGQKTLVILTSPGGDTFSNTLADSYIADGYTDIIILCGRYEGIDSRVQEILQAKAVSIGDYVLTGGELPALVMIDAITRRIPGVLPKMESIEEARVSSHEMYTRPNILAWKGKEYSVPEILKSGHHAEIDKWKEER